MRVDLQQQVEEREEQMSETAIPKVTSADQPDFVLVPLLEESQAEGESSHLADELEAAMAAI